MAEFEAVVGSADADADRRWVLRRRLSGRLLCMYELHPPVPFAEPPRAKPLHDARPRGVVVAHGDLTDASAGVEDPDARVQGRRVEARVPGPMTR